MFKRLLFTIGLVLAFVAMALIPADADSGNTFPTPTPGQTVVGVQMMCLNGASPQQAVPCSNSFPLPIAGSLSASLSTFNPTGQASLSVSNSSTRVAFGSADTSVIIQNIGANPAFFKFGDGTVVAATTDYPIPAGGCFNFATSGTADIAAITASSTTTLRVTTGTGLAAVSCGGGSGGGGGAVTAASGAYAAGSLAAGAGVDGWDLTQGAKADAVCGTATGTCSVVALIKYLNSTALGTGVPGTPNLTTVPTVQGAAGMTPVLIQPAFSASSANGIAPGVAGGAVSSKVLKAGAGNLYSAYAVCTSACWLFAINATSLPGNATLTAGVSSGNYEDCIFITANGSGSFNYVLSPEVFSTGITLALSSTACPILTASAVGSIIHGQVQ